MISATTKSKTNGWIYGVASVGVGALISYTNKDPIQSEGEPNLPNLIAKNIESACKSFVQQFGLDRVDPKKLENTFQKIRGESSSADGKQELRLEEFTKVVSVMGIENSDVAKSLFESLDADKSGTIDLREFSVALAGSAGDPARRLQALFSLCDLDGNGKVSKEEMAKTLLSLMASVNKMSHGELMSRARAGTKLTEEQVKETMVKEAVGEIFKEAGPAGVVDFSRFQAWVGGGSPSALAFVALFDSFRGALSDKSFFAETRYGAYAFLIARFVRTAKVAVRYLAFTSDVGEAFRPVVPVHLVNFTYAIAIAYCIGDVAYVGYQESKKPDGNVTRTVAERSLFQALASVVLPFLIIHTQVHVFHKLLHARGGNLAKFGPTVAGLALIPALPMVCDEPVEKGIEAAFHYAWPLPGHGEHADKKQH